MTPAISVIIPAFNEEKVITLCLKALRKQTLPKEKYEIIVVDNDSTDSTVEISKEYADQVLIYKEQHVVAAVRNYGVEHAKAPILAFMDSDSAASHDWLESILDVMKKDHLVAVCGPATPMKKTLYLNFLFGIYNLFLRGLQVAGIVVPWGFNLAVRRDAFKKIGGFDTTVKEFDDSDIGLRIQKTFGRRRVEYSQELHVDTSTRKQERIMEFLPYLWTATLNMFSIIFLRRIRRTEIKNVR